MLTPTLSSDGANKGYVDGLISTPGTGLTKVGTALNVNATQSQISRLGTDGVGVRFDTWLNMYHVGANASGQVINFNKTRSDSTI